MSNGILLDLSQCCADPLSIVAAIEVACDDVRGAGEDGESLLRGGIPSPCPDRARTQSGLSCESHVGLDDETSQ